MELELKYTIQQFIQQGLADIKNTVLNITKPLTEAPTGAPATPETPVITQEGDAASTLQPGTYYYAVSSVDDLRLESLPKDGDTYQVIVANLQKTKIVITNVTAATKYKIYRGITAGTLRYMTTIDKATGATTTYYDKGADGEFTNILTSIFPNRTSDERAAVLQFVRENPVKVILADPRDPAELPCYAIQRNDEIEQPQNIGDEIDEKPIDTLTAGETTGSDFSSVHTIEAWTTNTDVREFMYKIAKEIMFHNRRNFTELGCVEQSISGRDNQGMATPYIPEYVYVSSVTFSCKTLMSIDKTYNKVPTDIRAVVGNEI